MIRTTLLCLTSLILNSKNYKLILKHIFVQRLRHFNPFLCMVLYPEAMATCDLTQIMTGWLADLTQIMAGWLTDLTQIMAGWLADLTHIMAGWLGGIAGLDSWWALLLDAYGLVDLTYVCASAALCL